MKNQSNKAVSNTFLIQVSIFTDDESHATLVVLLNKLILYECAVHALTRLLVALSLETVRVAVDLFDLVIFLNGFLIKDETFVAADIKVFLPGSKLVGKVDSRPSSDMET